MKKNSIKCGEYWYKDGVVIKRPRKKFRLPPLPDKLRVNDEDDNICDLLTFFSFVDFDDKIEILKQNNKLEKEFQGKILALHARLRRMYILSQLTKFVSNTTKKLVRSSSHPIRSVELFSKTMGRS
ncbi:MAG: hypothetical protein IJV07_02405 [Alphaproteobacteria bacterium]|nr:hypothetical protein [Alphaproteobacteria bacterium]